jgi:hypothetical protein
MNKYKYSRLLDLTLLFCAGIVGGGLVTAVLINAYRAIM